MLAKDASTTSTAGSATVCTSCSETRLHFLRKWEESKDVKYVRTSVAFFASLRTILPLELTTTGKSWTKSKNATRLPRSCPNCAAMVPTHDEIGANGLPTWRTFREAVARLPH